jgi:molybdopterin biosynthesis enzyme
MHSLEDAIDLIATHLPNPGQEHAFVREASGRVLREELVLGECAGDEAVAPHLAAGTRLGPAHLAALALRGYNTVPVARRLPLAVAHAGSEPSPAADVCRMLRGGGLADVTAIPFKPGAADLPGQLATLMTDHPDVVLTGVDLKWRDEEMVPLLKTLGFAPICAEVSILPGGKLWFGQARTQQSVLMMSGDTYAHLVVAHRLLLQALRRLCRETEPAPDNVVLNKDVRFSHNFTLLAPARLKYDYHGQSSADPLPLRAGREAATLAESHGYLEFSRYRDFFQQGELVPFYRW